MKVNFYHALKPKYTILYSFHKKIQFPLLPTLDINIKSFLALSVSHSSITHEEVINGALMGNQDS